VTVDLRKVFDSYREAERARDAAQGHLDRGLRNARGYAAEGRLHAAADALEAAEKRWEKARMGYLARQEEREVGSA
jgi:hypothetical protein